MAHGTSMWGKQFFHEVNNQSNNLHAMLTRGIHMDIQQLRDGMDGVWHG